MTRKTEIEFELNETIAYTRSDERLGVFCPGCQTIVEMAVPHVASILAELSEREVCRRIVENEAHVVERDRLLVCIYSLTSSRKLADELITGD
jgi:hypothetical protein